MTPTEMDELIEQGIDALKAAKGLSGEEQAVVARAIARIEAGESPADVAADAKCELCKHPAHTGACPWRTAKSYCDCGLSAGAPIPEEQE